MKYFLPNLKALTYRVAYSRDKNKFFAFSSQALHHAITFKVPKIRQHVDIHWLVSVQSVGKPAVTGAVGIAFPVSKRRTAMIAIVLR